MQLKLKVNLLGLLAFVELFQANLIWFLLDQISILNQCATSKILKHVYIDRIMMCVEQLQHNMLIMFISRLYRFKMQTSKCEMASCIRVKSY